MPQTSTLSITALMAALAAAPAAAQSGQTHRWGDKNVPQFEPAFPQQTRAPLEATDVAVANETLAAGLEHPWAVAALPDGQGCLVAERPGRLRHIAPDGTVSDPIAGVPEVENRPAEGMDTAQGGLLDVKLGPDFAETRHVYLTYAKPLADGSATAAARGVLSEDMTELTQVEDIWVQTPPSPARMHYGSRIVFDGDGHAFITTGEHFTNEERQKAQDLETTYGKVVRVNLDGSIPDDNPFVGREGAEDSIWSYGHRNIQGAVMHDGRLYVIEHGPAGGDEVNVVEPGANYGWPVVSYGKRYDGDMIGSGDPRQDGMKEPLYYWDPVIAPGDAVIYEGDAFPDWQGDMLVAGLVSKSVVRVDLDDGRVRAEERVLGGHGRLRDIEVLSDGSLLLLTDKQNGEIVHVTPSDDGA
ncbi:Glucose/arabinose dehydrogenase, beta-propeller fold [Rhodovulum sp. ES.010]|uniref:PQQ-dependent sugar dehydrogenase n=1 Tax=Rhodovulum sp. ES.010 TaxID=1882821 RepID=UPI0009261B7A|nr:PQQ-dependent sugar dehydrogenase [Rhodovulum sp. ES.010]SIO06216.1 Glucose/arabinose dehydrogenase, beta-propeller fold [Rhodovulum sp. ES.010]